MKVATNTIDFLDGASGNGAAYTGLIGNLSGDNNIINLRELNNASSTLTASRTSWAAGNGLTATLVTNDIDQTAVLDSPDLTGFNDFYIVWLRQNFASSSVGSVFYLGGFNSKQNVDSNTQYLFKFTKTSSNYASVVGQKFNAVSGVFENVTRQIKIDLSTTFLALCYSNGTYGLLRVASAGAGVANFEYFLKIETNHNESATKTKTIFIYENVLSLVLDFTILSMVVEKGDFRTLEPFYSFNNFNNKFSASSYLDILDDDEYLVKYSLNQRDFLDSHGVRRYLGVLEINAYNSKVILVVNGVSVVVKIGQIKTFNLARNDIVFVYPCNNTCLITLSDK